VLGDDALAGPAFCLRPQTPVTPEQTRAADLPCAARSFGIGGPGHCPTARPLNLAAAVAMAMASSSAGSISMYWPLPTS
jgi:hypothetical protein